MICLARSLFVQKSRSTCQSMNELEVHAGVDLNVETLFMIHDALADLYWDVERMVPVIQVSLVPIKLSRWTPLTLQLLASYPTSPKPAMVRYTSLALAASIASFVSAAPAAVEKRTTIPVRKGHSSKSISAKSVVERDLARIANYNARKPASAGLEARASSGTITNEDVSYVASIEICTSYYSLIVDTGSSNLWVSL